MRQNAAQLRLHHHATIESYEPRCLMTGQTGDFYLDYDALTETSDGQVAEQQLYSGGYGLPSGIYDLTGLTSARANYGLTGAEQTVVVIDSGIAYDHAALGGGFGTGYRVVGGWDFTEENDANPYDDGPAGSHGTHVAGIIGSSSNKALGLAPGVDLVGLRVFNDQGIGYFHWIEQSLQWVHDHRNSFNNPITTVNLSIGSVWNSNDVPAWSSIEDELAQLEADGIFVSVAAGNSFTTYNTTGLSYPAASSYVVPVSAVDQNGNLASFSQRDPRVIAAPGQGIMSTVPDYVGNFNRKTDDFATYSGTSMAAPFVAGASVLIRQAMQLAGQTNITQDKIYDLMRSTGDIIFDAVTNQNYVRLNVGRALDSLMADDYGSTVATAKQLGTVTQTTVSGTIERTTDRDFFTFTAAKSGTAKFTASPGGSMSTVWNTSGGQTLAGNSHSLSVVAGQTYTVGISTGGGVGAYSISVDVQSNVEDWGQVNFRVIDSTSVNGERWLEFKAVNTGIFTVEALFQHSGGNVDIELYDANQKLLGSSATSRNYERLDASVTAGSKYLLRVGGANQDVDLRVTNLIVNSRGALTIYGTEGADVFRFRADATIALSIQGTHYQFATGQFRTAQFLGSGGDDAAFLVGSSGSDIFVMRAGWSRMTDSRFSLTVNDCELQHIEGGGGADFGRVYDTAGDDRCVIDWATVKLFAGNTQNILTDVRRIETFATAGGHDQVKFFDTAANDLFTATRATAILEGNGYRQWTTGFDHITVFAHHGGYDRAVLYDSVGDDTFGMADFATHIKTAAYVCRVETFERVDVYAVNGGQDLAILYDSGGNDLFTARRSFARMRSEHFETNAHGFESVEARAIHGGIDLADIHDSAGNDLFQAARNEARLSGLDYELLARGFHRVRATGSTGANVLALQTVDYVLDLNGRWI